MANPNVRRPGESQKQYRERRRDQNRALKHRQPRVLWDSRTNGTYRLAEHGPLS